MEWGVMEAIINKLGGREGVKRFLAGEIVVGKPGSVVKIKKTTPKAPNILKQVGEPINLPAVERFVARDKFKVDTNGELPIIFLGDNLRENFLDVVEENVQAATRKQYELLKSSVDRQILAALGDKNIAKIQKAKTAFAHVFEFLKTADRTKWFIFYVADAKGIVWAVHADWYSVIVGWSVAADSVESPRRWSTGSQFISR